MPSVHLNTGIRMHYRDGGKGKPIVLIPGLAATVDTWNYQVLGLNDRYRCVCVDLRGHGDSDKPYSEYSYDEMSGDIDALLEALDLRDVTLVGWSMGAGIALNYVSKLNRDGRVTRLAMIAPATPRFLSTKTEPYGVDSETADATLEAMRVALPETMAAFADANFHRSDMTATANWFLSMWLKMPAYVGYKCFKSLMNEDLRGALETLGLPTLICHGRHDQVCDPGWSEFMAARILECRLVWFENSGHALMVEEPDVLSRELRKFVSD